MVKHRDTQENNGKTMGRQWENHGNNMLTIVNNGNDASWCLTTWETYDGFLKSGIPKPPRLFEY